MSDVGIGKFSDDDGAYSLLMPFVTVASKGGPHDDDSYTAGYEMGKLDFQLQAADALNLEPPKLVTVRRDNMEQVDLIAMRHGFIADEVAITLDGDEFRPSELQLIREQWAHVGFSRPENVEEP